MLGNTNIKKILMYMLIYSTRACKIKKSLVSDLGIPKMYLTSLNKKNTHIYTHTHTYIIRELSKCQSNTFQYTYIEEGSLFHYLQGIGRIYFNTFKAMYDPFKRRTGQINTV